MLFESTSPLARLGELMNDEVGLSQAMSVVVIASIALIVVIAVMTLLGDAIFGKAVEVAGDIQGASW